MENEIMSQEDLEKELETPGSDSLSLDEGGDTLPETQTEDVPAGDVEAETPASGDADPAPISQKPAAEAVPYWRFKEELDRRKQAEAERTQLLQRLATGQPNPQDPPKPKDEETAPVPPDPKAFTDYDVYLDAERKYNAANAEWVSKQTVAREWTRRLQEQQTNAQQQSFQDRIDKAQRNWETSVREAVAKDPNVRADIDAAMSMPKLVGLKVMESKEHAAELAAAIGRQGLAEKLWSMSPDEQIWTVAQLEAEIAHGKKSAPGNGGPVKKPSASVPVLAPAKLGNQHSSADIFHKDVEVDVFARGLFPLPG